MLSPLPLLKGKSFPTHENPILANERIQLTFWKTGLRHCASHRDLTILEWRDTSFDSVVGSG